MSVLNFFGDVFLDRPVRAVVPLAGDYIVNLEAPVTHALRPEWGKINLKAGGLFFKETFGRNPAAVCLANNHIMDYGEAGFQDTLASLRAEGIAFFGAGSLADNCHNPLLLAAGAGRVALLGYACPTTHPLLACAKRPGAAPLDLERIAMDIRSAQKCGTGRVIVQLHWGEEDVGLPRPVDVATAHRIIDLGADLIIGHHAHCIQPFEIYRGKPIFYGLGNAVFPDTDMVSHAPDGSREGNRQMKWGKRNRRSLLVGFDTVTGQVSMRRLFFSDALAVVANGRLPGALAFTNGATARYERRFARVLRLSLLRRLAVSFISRPRLPKRQNLHWLLQRFKVDKKN